MIRTSIIPSRLLVLALFALAAVPAWVRGGTPQDLQGSLPWLGAIALLVAAGSGLRSASGDPAGIRRWLGDPVFYAGILFLGVLGLQWHYAGRVQFFDPVALTWGYTPPVRPGWPSAFTRAEAAEMLRWFFPAWAAILAIRSGFLGKAGAIRLFRFLAVNAAAIGVAGIVQQQLGTRFFPFTAGIEKDLRIFASFGYENHASSFFVLAAALSAGLAVRDLLAPDRRRRRGRIALMIAAFMVNLAAGHLALSRAGILMAWILVAAGVTWGSVRAWRGLSPAGRINAFAGGAAVLLALAMGIIVFGRESIGRELESIGQPPDPEVEQAYPSPPLGTRIAFGRAALDVLKAQPVFGVGGWGLRYLLPYSQPEDGWGWTNYRGMANAHNDPLQFLAEFGVVGAGLMALVVVAVLVPAFRRGPDGRRPGWGNPVVFFVLAGAFLVWLHSLIDLPFRSPAVLLAWVIALAGASELVGERSRKDATWKGMRSTAVPSRPSRLGVKIRS